jgi:cytochrome P450
LKYLYKYCIFDIEATRFTVRKPEVKMPTLQHELPKIDSHTVPFLDDPNDILGRGPDRVQVAEGRVGTEFFSYETVRSVFREDRLMPRSPQLYIDKGVAGGPILDYLVEGNLSLTWPSTHDRLRPLLVKGFRPKRINDFKTTIQATAERLVDALAGSGAMDVVQEFSHRFSISVIAGFIGIPPEDVPEFENATVKLRLLGQEPFLPGVPELEAALSSVRDYSQRVVDARRAHPRDDMISDLIAVQDEEGESAISESELVWNIAGVLLAGHDTTRYQLASTVRAVLENGHWERLHDEPGLIPVAVAEAMRIYPATPRQIRVVQEPLTLDGVDLEVGDVVTINMSAAGRDPNVFATPDAMVFDRGEPKYDIGFGYGQRYCLGFAVARAELELGMSVLTQRLTDVELNAVEVSPTGVIAGPESVRISFRERTQE